MVRRGGSGAPSAGEMRQRVIAAINKLADRDTYQMACRELELVAESLAPESLGSFLSCLYETDAQQKSTVRKECVGLLGAMARFHGDRVAPHLPRMAACLVKRLKDPDSNVRDSCVLSFADIASHVAVPSPFSVLAKPLLDHIGEQNRHLQIGCALGLARVIDNVTETPQPIVLHRLLHKIVKLLNHQNYAGKTGLLAVIGSVAQAGGASSQQVLGFTIPAVQNALRSSEWATRKAASEAFYCMAIGTPDMLTPFKASCLSSLEACRFDKVKPVRDSVIQTLQAWKEVPESDEQTTPPKYSAKENLHDNHHRSSLHSSKPVMSSRSPPDIDSACGIKKQTFITPRKTKPFLHSKNARGKLDDWQIEVTVPHRQQRHAISNENFNRSHKSNSSGKNIVRKGTVMTSEELESSLKTSEKTDIPRISDFETKCVVMDQNLGVKNRVEVDSDGKEHKSAMTPVYCAKEFKGQDISELTQIRKQLSKIESQQSNLLELFKVYIGSSQESMQSLESRVRGLERTVEGMVHDLSATIGELQTVQGDKVTCCNFLGTDFLSSKFRRKSVSRSSEILSRGKFGMTPSHKDDREVDSSENRKYRGMLSIMNPLADYKVTSKEEITELNIEGVQKMTLENTKGAEPKIESLDRNGISEGSSSRRAWRSLKDESTQPAMRVAQRDEFIEVFNSRDECRRAGSNTFSEKSFWSMWSRVVELLQLGDVDTAFMEILCSGDELLLIRLMNRTGLVLEQLSSGTIFKILQALIRFLSKQKHLDLSIVWLHKIIDMIASNGPDYMCLSTEIKVETLSTLHECASILMANCSSKKVIAHIAAKLSKAWAID